MSNQDLGSVLLAVLLLIVGASLLGQLFSRLRQPKVVGEILAGVLLGPTLLGNVAPGFAADVFGAEKTDPQAVVLGFMYNLGLLLGSAPPARRLILPRTRTGPRGIPGADPVGAGGFPPVLP